METSGGGWTLIVAQFENDQTSGWNEGVRSDYDPSLATGKSFTLSTEQIPSHSELSFGKDHDPVFVTSITFQYSTGNIPLQTVTGTDGLEYQIHRDTDFYYGWHNPEENTGSDDAWKNALTLDKTGGRNFSWAFSQNVGEARARGFGMQGNHRYTTDTFAWTLWVR